MPSPSFLSRRTLLRLLSGLPFGGYLGHAVATSAGADASSLTSAVSSTSATSTVAAAPISTYASLGVRPLINARGTVTIVGATRVLPEVQEAMELATRNYVQLDELMEAVGPRLGALTGSEWGIVTSGASGAITVATAGVLTGGDPDKLWRLPELDGMKDEVIIPSYSRTAYDMAAKAAGVRMVEVESVDDLRSAIGPQTAMILVLAGRQSNEGPLSTSEIASIAHMHDVPVLVDAAAEGLYRPNPHLEQGADLVAYSGGKYLRGPQCTGLLIGREDLVRAAWLNSAPHHGPGRGYKVGREEIMGMLTAVEMWFERDHETEWATWEARLAHVANRLSSISGVTTEVNEPSGLSNRSPSLSIRWDPEQIPLAGHEVEQLLWDGEPRIAVSGMGSFLPFPPNEDPTIRINPSQLADGAEVVIADRVAAVLAEPPHVERPSGAPAQNVAGQWVLDMTFAAGTANQRLVIEQDGSTLVGTHFAEFGPRDLLGSLHGREILFRSSTTNRGVRINYTFRGDVDGDEMGGSVHMGEYGMAEWRAVRRHYDP